MMEEDGSANVGMDNRSDQEARSFKTHSLYSEILSRLINAKNDELEQAISWTLSRVGEFADVDRTYVIKALPNDRFRLSQRWSAPGIWAGTGDLEAETSSTISPWLRDLTKGCPVQVPDMAIGQLHARGAPEGLWQSGTRSVLLIPMFDGRHLMGALGFDCVRTQRTFSSFEIDVLLSVTEIIGAALRRQQMAQDMATAEAELRLQRERFRIIADTVSDVLWDHDFEEKKWWINKDWPDKLGIAARASEGDASSWFSRVYPDDRDKLLSSFHEVLRSTSDTWEVEYRIVGDEGALLDICTKATVFRSASGRVLRMLGNSRNVTHQRRRQEAESRARALETVGKFTGGIAHDFNNLLMIIIGNLERLEKEDLKGELAETVGLISEATQSAAKLTSQLLTFSQQGYLDSKAIDVGGLLSDTLQLLRTLFPESVNLSQSVPGDLPVVRADPNGLQQAIINLAMNANDAMPDGGEIDFHCAEVAVSADRPVEGVSLEPGRYVVISVSDTGTGMSASTLSRAFEPFFTTKDVGRGTGLGLSAVHGFVTRSGGGAAISTKIGQGTKVSLYLPADDGDVDCREVSDTATPVNFEVSEKRILLVEDEPQVRALVQKALSKIGYDVTVTPDASSALALAKNGAVFDLLFTDVVMPGGMNGKELACQMLTLQPGIKILYTSGYPADAFGDALSGEPESINFLPKPYRTSQLIEKVEQALIGSS